MSAAIRQVDLREPISRFPLNYSFLFRDNNYYDPLQDQFIPAKQKHLAGASVTYAATPTSSITVRGSHAWVRQDDGPLLLSEAGPRAPDAAAADVEI